MEQYNQRIPMSASQRQRLYRVIVCLVILVLLLLGAYLIQPHHLTTNFRAKQLPPSTNYWFGTDWLGRNMAFRVFKGLALSIQMGLLASVGSLVIAILLSILVLYMPRMKSVIDIVSNTFLTVPHLLLLMIISYSVGNGVRGVTLALALTHWVTPMRYFMKELEQLQQQEYIIVSIFLGKKTSWILRHHYLPLLAPRIALSGILLFPHVLLHEAAMTFLGFGLKNNMPAIGNILQESLGYLLRGSWWLMLCPGVAFVCLIILLERLGEDMKQLIFPNNH